MFGHEPLRTDEEHAARVVEMFQWLKAKSPLKAMCPWCLAYEGFDSSFDARFRDDGWFRSVNGRLQPRPVVEALRGMADRSVSFLTECSEATEVDPQGIGLKPHDYLETDDPW